MEEKAFWRPNCRFSLCPPAPGRLLLLVIDGFGGVGRNPLANGSISVMDEEPRSKSAPTDTNYFNLPLFMMDWEFMESRAGVWDSIVEAGCP